MHYTAEPVEQIDLKVGDRVRLANNNQKLPPKLWTIQAVSEHYAVAVQQVAFKPKGTLQYTVLDWRNGVRGPCNLIGQGFGDGSYSQADCEEMLTGFEYVLEEDPNYIAAMAKGEKSWPSGFQLEVSHRNWVRLEVLEVLKD